MFVSEVVRLAKKIDLTGQKFGRLTVIEKVGVRNRKAIWKCRCDCGEYREVPTCHLRSGHTQSCGCYHAEISKTVNTTHGGRKERLYGIWAGIKNRCLNPNEPAYIHYGGRGIVICKEWLNSYDTFKKWALSHGYEENLTIERINVNGNYEPSNCKWITKAAQNYNKTDNVFITYNGETKILKQWADEFGIPKETIRGRLLRGVDIEHLFDKRELVSITYNGETKPIIEWAKEMRMEYNTILKRYRRGLTPEQIFDKSKIKK